ncbi:MAG: redoxin domain-containing protein [Gaiellaceae bacterium]
MVTEGNPAPDFELPSGDGNAVRLSELRGRPVVL